WGTAGVGPGGTMGSEPGEVPVMSTSRSRLSISFFPSSDWAENMLSRKRPQPDKETTMATISETASNVGKLIRHAIGAVWSPARAGDEKIASRQPGTGAAPHTLKVPSGSFLPNQPIPDRHTP